MQTYLQEHSPTANNVKIKTVRDVLTTWTPTLVNLKEVHGREWVIAYISAWILELNENSNVKQKMSPGQIDFASERIFESYSLRLADLTLFFRQVKEGVFGSFYENLSLEKLMEWLSVYFDKRCEMAQIVSYATHDEFSTKIDKMHPKVLEKMFEGVGSEEIKTQQNGVGSRLKNKLKMEESYGQYRASLTENAKKLTEEDLTEKVNTWGRREDLKFYVDIFQAELERRKK